MSARETSRSINARSRRKFWVRQSVDSRRAAMSVLLRISWVPKGRMAKPRGRSGTHAEGDYTSRALDERQDEQEVPRGAPLSLAEKRYPWRNPTHPPSRLAVRNRAEDGRAQPCVSAVGSDEVRLLYG